MCFMANNFIQSASHTTPTMFAKSDPLASVYLALIYAVAGLTAAFEPLGA